MCGIAGVLAVDDSFAIDEATVRRMTDVLRHRGPDDGGVLTRPDERVALGHRRLSIIDLSSAGHQPMANEDGTVWITYNGEVYNHADLRKELEPRGHRYRSDTDTETIVHLYEEHGAGCLERLHGMFGLAIWDARRRTLLLARDRLGVKPLYYAQLPNGLLFGSEVKAILEHPAAPRDLDEDALADYLTYGFVPPPRTMFRGIGKLGPAEAMTVAADGTTRRWSWWDPMPSASVSSAVAQMGEAEMVGEVRRLLRESIRKRMMSDVPFGVFLSGGLDSSTNVALMTELSDARVRTYSTAPRGHARYDELRYARLIAGHFATDHHEVLVDEQAMRAFIPQLVFHQDEPLSDWTAIPQHFVTRLARESGTIVVQVGEGADELFHGYQGYVAHRRVVVPFQRLLPRAVRRPVGAVAVHATARVGRAVRHGEALYDAGHSRIPYWGGALCFRGPLKDRLLRGDHPDALRTAERIWDEAGANRSDADIFQRMTYLELRQRLPELLLSRMDRIAMASSVEAREPFLDHELVEFVMALPPAMKHRDGHGKHVLREAMRDTLPPEILARSKQGFASPMEEWLSGAFGRDAQAAVGRSALPTAEWRGRRRRLCSGLPPAAPQISSRRDFWTEYQPGFRASDAPVGSQAFFADVEAHRYALEPHIGELVEFGRWSGKSVLDAGCGIATDGMRFVRAGARYTGIDFSPTALELARRRLELEGGEARLVHGSIANLPFPDASFDLVYSHGVIHHLPDTGRVIGEFHRVLRPGGTAIVMVYHRRSFNFYVSIMTLRRLLASALLIPGATRAIARATGERPEILEGHRSLLRAEGLRYLTDPALFLSHNTDGPGNPLSKVYTATGIGRAFSQFSNVQTKVRFLNLRAYPMGERLERLEWVQRLGRRYGWHLWIRATRR